MNELRAKGLRARRRMTPHARAKISAQICNRVTRSRVFLSAGAIACYLPTYDEVDTHPIIERAWRANKRIFVPVLRTNHKMLFREIQPETTLERNHYGVWEPATGDFIDSHRLDVVIVPTVAYDEDNNRIGMGGGYFDRCFAFLRHRKRWFRPKLVGVAFDCQKVEEITPNSWDIRLYSVFSNSK